MDSDADTGERVPRAVQACHELLAWLIPLLDHFPRARRFTLGERLESGLLAVLEDLVEAAYNRDRPRLTGRGAPNSQRNQRRYHEEVQR